MASVGRVHGVTSGLRRVTMSADTSESCSVEGLTPVVSRRPARPGPAPGWVPGAGGVGSGPGQESAQAAPLRVNEVGVAVLPVWLAWKPKEVEPPAGIEPL